MCRSISALHSLVESGVPSPRGIQRQAVCSSCFCCGLASLSLLPQLLASLQESWTNPSLGSPSESVGVRMTRFGKDKSKFSFTATHVFLLHCRSQPSRTSDRLVDRVQEGRCVPRPTHCLWPACIQAREAAHLLRQAPVHALSL
jgi:hypothetical protein